MAAAANRIPGATLNRWPEATTLRTASRIEQVDGVVAALLGGYASPQTREILTTGVHPMVANAATDSTASMVVAVDSTSDPDPDPTMVPDEPPARRRRTAIPIKPLRHAPPISSHA